MQFLTDFGDSAVLLPLSFCVALVFGALGWWRGALAWVIAIGLTLLVMVILKLTLFACGRLLPIPGLHSPSGHTAASAAVYGGLLGVVSRRVTGTVRWVVPGALLVAVVIGVSRLALGVHTPLEVGLGGSIGVGGATAMVMLAGPPPTTLRLRRLGATALLVLLLLHGTHLPAEARMRSMATAIWPLSYCHRPARPSPWQMSHVTARAAPRSMTS